MSRLHHGPNPRVALVCHEQDWMGPMARLFRRMGGQVEVAGSMAVAGDPASYSLVAVHYDNLRPADRRNLLERFSERSSPPLMLLSRELNHGDLSVLFGAHVLTNLVCIGETGPDLSDLLVTLRKLGRREIFGLDKYFAWGVDVLPLTIRASSERSAAIDAIDRYARDRAVPRRLRGLISTVVDEFLSNALYNAPTDDDGVSRFAHRPRTEAVVLAPGEQLDVCYCCDGRRFGLSTSDPFGSLSPPVILDNLARAFRGEGDQMQQTSGAGLGFFQMYDSLSHLVVNIEPRVSTEMIGLIDVSGGYRKFIESGKSFNIFMTEPRS